MARFRTQQMQEAGGRKPPGEEGPGNPFDKMVKPPESSLLAQKTLTILLVDDYPNILRVMNSVVSGLGHNTKTARSGEEALEIFKKGGIDLVITDFKMSGMNGLELWKKLKEHDSKAEVIILTAYADKLGRDPLVKANAITVLGKPLERDSIAEAIEAVRHNQ